MTKKKQPMRERVLDGAMSLITERATEWSISQLAASIEVSRGSVHRYFASKEALLQALQDERGAEFHAKALQAPRERILDAVKEVARQKGLLHSTIQEIAKEAEVGEATVYRHFGDRAGLLQAYADERTPRALLLHMTELPRANDVGELKALLQPLAAAAIQLWIDQGPMLASSLQTQRSPEDDAISAHLLDLEASARQLLSDLLKAQVDQGLLQGDPDVLAAALIGLIAGVTLRDIKAAECSIGALSETAVTLFLHGCTARQPQKKEEARP